VNRISKDEIARKLALIKSRRAATADSWPAALRPLKVLAQPGDRGAGDIIARKVGPIGGDKFKKWYKAMFGTDCRCTARQANWNRRYPL